MNVFFNTTIPCIFLTTASITAMVERETQVNQNLKKDSLMRALSNCSNAITLGCIFTATIAALNEKISPVPVVISSLFSLTLSGVAYLDRNYNCFNNKFDSWDQNIGKWMDLFTRIGSLAVLYLLAPNATKSPLYFSLATLSVIWNFGNKINMDIRQGMELI